MTKIEFDEPSGGRVTADVDAFEVRNNGKSAAIAGKAPSHIGVFGFSETSHGVQGASKSEIGVLGSCDEMGVGVKGVCENGHGVFGVSNTDRGVFGAAKSSGFGVVGSCDGEGVGVWGVNNPKDGIGVLGESEKGIGIYGKGRIAGRFEGNVEVTGDIRLLNADCAEDFDVTDTESKDVEPGTVMVLTENSSLQPSYQEYDKKVAGIVSGAKWI